MGVAIFHSVGPSSGDIRYFVVSLCSFWENFYYAPRFFKSLMVFMWQMFVNLMMDICQQKLCIFPSEWLLYVDGTSLPPWLLHRPTEGERRCDAFVQVYRHRREHPVHSQASSTPLKLWINSFHQHHRHHHDCPQHHQKCGSSPSTTSTSKIHPQSAEVKVTWNGKPENKWSTCAGGQLSEHG